MTCWRPCTTRPASAWPPCRSATCAASWSWTWATARLPKAPNRPPRARKPASPTPASSSIRRSCGPRTRPYCYEEGCLSIPEYFDSVERPARVRVAYLNREGERIEEEIEGLYAVCYQHELDHLNGVLFIDHLSRLRRDRAMSKVKKTMRLREDA